MPIDALADLIARSGGTVDAAGHTLTVDVVPTKEDFGPNAGKIVNQPYIVDTQGNKVVSLPITPGRTDLPMVPLHTKDGSIVMVPQTAWELAVRQINSATSGNSDVAGTGPAGVVVGGATPKPSAGGAGTGTGAAPAKTTDTSASPAAGLTRKEYDAYKASAQTALRTMGVLDYEPTDSEIASFFKSGFDAEAIATYYMSDPTFVARNPGSPWGISRDAYTTKLGNYQTAWASAFGNGKPMVSAPGPSATKAERDSNLIGYAIKQGINGQEFGQTLEAFRQTRGRAPSTTEYADFTAQQRTAAGGIPTGGGAGGSSSGGPRGVSRSETRAAV